MSGVVFDTEPVIAEARGRLADAGLSVRIAPTHPPPSLIEGVPAAPI
jgi:hypothetical protein